MAEKKEKQYVSDNARLMAEWNWEKNNELGFDPNQLTCGSGKKVWWKCNNGHEWEATIHGRSGGNGCPYCSNKKVLTGYNDLQTTNSLLAKEWNYEKNGDLKPENFTTNSGKRIWWKCIKGHEWQAIIANRNKGFGCPYCAGQKAVEGENDLQTLNPSLIEEWNFEKNNGLMPIEVMPNSDKKIWWKCKKGHEWQAIVGSRNKGIGCPYCSGRYAVMGVTDLQTVNPLLAKEWNYEKNGNLIPENFTTSSGKKVWWICTKGHEWQATINHRNHGEDCPICDSERKTSFPEYELAYYLKKGGLEIIHSYKELGYELDIYIPSKKIAIEYDGYFWHQNKTKKDLLKNQKCKNDGIQLYRIREGLSTLNDSSIDYILRKDQKDWSKTLKEIVDTITGDNIDVDLERDALSIENLREYTEKEKSVLFSNPKVAEEWNYIKNGKLKPEYFAENSNKKVWWRCNQGHEWQAVIANRTKGSGCPECTKEKRKKKNT